MEIRNQIDYHQILLDRCTTLISACDTKASFALAFIGVITGMTAFGNHEEYVSDCIIPVYVRYVSMIFLIISCILFLLTIMPQGKLKSKHNFLIDRMNSINDDVAYLKKLKEQIVDSANIYSRKCCFYKWGTLFLVASLLLILLLEMFLFNRFCA